MNVRLTRWPWAVSVLALILFVGAHVRHQRRMSALEPRVSLGPPLSAVRRHDAASAVAGDGGALKVPGVIPHAHAPPTAERPAQPVRYLVLATHRTGSTLLCQMLDQTDDATCLAEMLYMYHDFRVKETKIDDGDDDPIFSDWSLYERVLSLAFDRHGPHSQRASDASALRSTIIEQFSRTPKWATARVLGFKLKYNHMFHDASRLFDYLERNGVRIVHLVRRAALDAFVSMVVAQKTGTWHNFAGVDLPNDLTIKVDPEEVLRALREADSEREALVAEIRARPAIPYLEVLYEEFAGEFALRDYMRIARFLSLPADEATARNVIGAVAAQMHPAASLACKDRFSNWAALRTALIEAGRVNDVEICERTTHPALAA